MPETLEKPELLEIPSRICSVCGSGTFQILPRNRNRKTERLECEHGFEPWHFQAEVLQREIDATVSPSLKRLLNVDLEQILTRRSSF